MESALIVTSTEKSIPFISQMLSQAEIDKINSVASAGEARRLLIEHDYDLCVINAPLVDEFGENLARNIASKGIGEVILLVKSELYDEVCDKVEDMGVVVVAKPLSKALFWNAIKMTQAAHRRMKRIQSENNKLLKKIEDIRIVDRAKCLLISYLSMTEMEAHRHIEKQAMDTRSTKRAIAEEIIKTYEN